MRSYLPSCCLMIWLYMLLAMTNADRCFDLAALDLTYQSFQGNGVKFIIPGFETQWPTKGGLLSSICTSSKAMSSSDPSVLRKEVREAAYLW